MFVMVRGKNFHWSFTCWRLGPQWMVWGYLTLWQWGVWACGHHWGPALEGDPSCSSLSFAPESSFWALSLLCIPRYSLLSQAQKCKQSQLFILFHLPCYSVRKLSNRIFCLFINFVVVGTRPSRVTVPLSYITSALYFLFWDRLGSNLRTSWSEFHNAEITAQCSSFPLVSLIYQENGKKTF